MTASTLTLADFLLARIAEDEESARGADGEQFFIDDGPWTLAFLDRHGPARVLAECEAKRRIVEDHRGYGGSPDPEWAPEGYCGVCDGTLPAPCGTVRLLALPYADHPDFREEWRV